MTVELELDCVSKAPLPQVSIEILHVQLNLHPQLTYQGPQYQRDRQAITLTEIASSVRLVTLPKEGMHSSPSFSVSKSPNRTPANRAPDATSETASTVSEWTNWALGR